ncbi:unnamed protein product [Cuscuta epithymum]|uniref:Uncharacterized protein n=1 Tax=Cuscuta epithymum TaxID=186058 RepID=A0AAV0CHC8_9ASTE|nr:unnamed protein product [Cuscuta epithymum]CAH9121035.1 unnamed protein product [Cuscuta epithymum]
MAAEGEEQPLTYMDEVVLKKRRNNEEWAIRRKHQLEQKVRKLKSDSFIIKKPEQFIKEYRDRELDLVRMKQRGKRRLPAFPMSKLLFVIRIGGKNDMHPKTRKYLYSLRLGKVFDGVFLKADEKSLGILQKLEPYITYGYPNLKSVRDLIFKKGTGKVGKQRVPLTDNNIIEQALGQHGIICLEDIINEIANVGPHFKDVSSFLYPFLLNKPEKALQAKKKRYSDGGDCGNRECHINELISEMN